MNVRRFNGSNSREAIAAVKRELGKDAVILANRKVEGGVEILALPPEAVPDAATAAVRNGAAPRQAAAGGEAWANSVVTEIKSLRGVLEDQLGGLVWGDLQRREPVRARLLRDLLHAGFSPAIGRFLTDNLPAGGDAEQGLHWLQGALARNLNCAAEDEILAAGGVFALMGPTGVGKTTTTAKLAARCVVRHGADKLALVTTDGYRIGAHEQLRIFGKILGVAVHTVRDGEDLHATLGALRAKHMVLIDTVGMSQRDKALAEQIGMLCGAGGKVNRFLLLNAGASRDTLDEAVRAYRGTDGLAGVVLTKVDEAVTLGGALDVIVRHRLRLHYVCNGQRVPEDLRAANRDYLLHRALRERGTEQVFRLGDAEMPALLGITRASAPAMPFRAGA